jgi:hypothetical protein
MEISTHDAILISKVSVLWSFCFFLFPLRLLYWFIIFFFFIIIIIIIIIFIIIPGIRRARQGFVWSQRHASDRSLQTERPQPPADMRRTK